MRASFRSFLTIRKEHYNNSFTELNNLDMIDALDKCIDVALMWHRINAAVKAQLLQSNVHNFLKIYGG
ncbi:MAG TPA: hypothetical protein VF870_16175 [Ignavibacteriaceae bacterium]